jgi:hypothetical protein
VPTIWIDQEGSRVSAVGDSGRMGASLLRLWARRRMRQKGQTPMSHSTLGSDPNVADPNVATRDPNVAAGRREVVHDRP